MKEYKITIQIEEVKKTSLMSSILAEVEQEKKDKESTEKVNAEIGVLRQYYFENLLRQLNSELEGVIGSPFKIVHRCDYGNGMLQLGTGGVWINNNYVLELRPIEDKVKPIPTNYKISTKDFEIILLVGRGGRINSRYVLNKENIIESFLSVSKEDIKKELHNK